MQLVQWDSGPENIQDNQLPRLPCSKQKKQNPWKVGRIQFLSHRIRDLRLSTKVQSKTKKKRTPPLIESDSGLWTNPMKSLSMSLWYRQILILSKTDTLLILTMTCGSYPTSLSSSMQETSFSHLSSRTRGTTEQALSMTMPRCAPQTQPWPRYDGSS